MAPTLEELLEGAWRGEKPMDDWPFCGMLKILRKKLAYSSIQSVIATHR